MAPINLVNLESVTLALGTQILLDRVSLGVAAGMRIGVVGRNGGGKTTLLRVLAGLQPVDRGRVTPTGGLTVAVLGQDDALLPTATVRECVVGQLADHEWAGDPRARDVLSGLLGDLQASAVGGLEAVVGPMSGGERRRIALAKHLIADPDLLLLDEPTNHLDVEGVAWLAGHLAARRPSSALVAITHDRWFLDAMATTTWEVHDAQIDAYDGGYAAYVLARAERNRAAAVTEDRRQNLLRKELAWLRRGPPARTAKPQFRIDAANALIADVPAIRDEVELLRFASTRQGKDVIDVEGISLRLGERVLFDDLTWRLGPGDRIGIIGVNGSGKSTLLRLLSGDAQPDSGRLRTGKTVRLAFLSQEVRELDELADCQVVKAISQVREVTRLGDKEVTASQLAERLGFTGIRQQSLVRELSGGERRRLQLLRLLVDEPNVLLLDEPTNDLDVDTLTALEDLLDGWAGTLIVVSHDRYTLERMCSRQVALLGDGQLRDLPGGVEEYLALRAARPNGPRGSAKSASGTPSGAIVPDAEPTTSADRRQLQKLMAKWERRLSQLTTQVAQLHAKLAVAATDHAEVIRLDQQLRELLAEQEDVESQWLAAAEELS